MRSKVFSRPLTYRHTLLAAYVGYLTQALVINYPPLLFLTFRTTYGLSLSDISILIAVSFTSQLMIDFIVSRTADRMGFRTLALLSHIVAVAGMLSYGFLPDVFAGLGCPMAGLCISTVVASAGGGIIEVVISPLVEACPTPEKSGAMSLLHSFFCWGQAGTVLFSTLFFALCGVEHWRLLSCLWAILPALGVFAFSVVPIFELKDEKTAATAEKSGGNPLRTPLFFLFFLLMICAGAAEEVMSQWASSFAESALAVSKTTGDLLGPMCFALLMGVARMLYSRNSHRLRLLPCMVISLSLCVVSYLIAALSPLPLLSLIGCGLCGLAIGILWPGTYSWAAERLPGGGVTMFALLALAGDIGCLTGPSLAGKVADFFGGELRYAFLFAICFPLIALSAIFILVKKPSKSTGKELQKKNENKNAE